MMSNEKSIVAVIPARGGSKGIPRKNIRPMNGIPLISYSIEVAMKAKQIGRVVVTTDDEEIATIAQKKGVEVRKRPPHLATDEVTLDPVIYDVITDLEKQGMKLDIVLTIQPTSPLTTSHSIDQAIEKLQQERVDTVITAVNRPHLSWKKIDGQYIPQYKERKNRQYLPPHFVETGSLLASKRDVHTPTNRIGENITLLELDAEESIDIDSIRDWWVAEKILNKKSVAVRVDGYQNIGLGHVHRMLLLADHITDHDLTFVVHDDDELAQHLIGSRNYKMRTFHHNPLPILRELNPDIVINDILDTSKAYIRALKKCNVRVVNFEDLGPGAKYADAVINALYQSPVQLPHFYTGEKYYCARHEFVHATRKRIQSKVQNVLLTFGGVDPNQLTLKTLQAISRSNKDFAMTVILGSGYMDDETLYREIEHLDREVTVLRAVKNMAEQMAQADIVFTSAGRTMYEIAMIGTPAILIAQNSRECTHTFGHFYNGFYNLGLHSEVDQHKILSAFETLYTDVSLREELHERMTQHDFTKGIQRVCSIIFNGEEDGDEQRVQS